MRDVGNLNILSVLSFFFVRARKTFIEMATCLKAAQKIRIANPEVSFQPPKESSGNAIRRERGEVGAIHQEVESSLISQRNPHSEEI